MNTVLARLLEAVPGKQYSLRLDETAEALQQALHDKHVRAKPPLQATRTPTLTLRLTTNPTLALALALTLALALALALTRAWRSRRAP